MMTTQTKDTANRDHHAGDANPGFEIAGRHIHFIGIGGCGMSGLARMVQQIGGACSGSDLVETQTTESLANDGIAVAFEQSAAAVPQDAEIVVYSAAIRPDHPERQEAERRGLVTMKYAAMLGQLMVGRNGIAIAGTHGKSSTTSMLAHVLIQCGIDPSVIVGANCRQIGGGWRVGQSDVLLAEACEFDRSFHNFHPRHAAILNVEADHLDMYKSLDEIVEAFAVFARKVPADGSLLVNHEMPHRLNITAGLDCTVESIGFAPQADWRVEIRGRRSQDSGQKTRLRSQGPQGGASSRIVQLSYRGDVVARWSNPLPGEHMAYNAAAAAVIANRLGASWESITPALESFSGLDRRMQVVGEKPSSHQTTKPTSETCESIEPAVNAWIGGNASSSTLVIDDYGHHPTEVDTTLRALRQHYEPERLICIFQPHQHSRTRFLMEQFAASFSQADIVIVPHIYFVRDSEQERHAVSANDLVDRLRKQGLQAMHLYPFEAIVEHLQIIARPGDLIVTMGAGDVWKIGRAFLSE